jgi:hypothetical protein
MDNPADMINAALEELIKQRYEMSAFSALDRLTERVRTLVYGRICRMVQRRMIADIQHRLEALFEAQLSSHRSLPIHSPTQDHVLITAPPFHPLGKLCRDPICLCSQVCQH